jgi:hypothetical protein
MPEAEAIGDRSYVSLPSQGVSLVLLDNERVGVIQLHGAGHEGFVQFHGDMPGSLAFGMSRGQVRLLRGTPDRHGEMQAIPVLGDKPAWDSFVIDGVRLHVEYSIKDQLVQVVSLTAA